MQAVKLPNIKTIFDTSELNGMKNFAIKNRVLVLQRDRVLLLQKRVLERYYCTDKKIRH